MARQFHFLSSLAVTESEAHMKKLAFLFFAVVFWSGCASTDIKNELKQPGEVINSDMPQGHLEEFDPEQSQKRVNEMLLLQRRIQDINSEISRLIEYHHNQIDKLIDEKDILSKKLNELYNLEKEYQGLK